MVERPDFFLSVGGRGEKVGGRRGQTGGILAGSTEVTFDQLFYRGERREARRESILGLRLGTVCVAEKFFEIPPFLEG